MTYEQLIETVSIMVENEQIHKTGLSLTYTLNEKNYKGMNEFLFYKSHDINDEFIPSDNFEVEIGGILITFIKEKL